MSLLPRAVATRLADPLADPVEDRSRLRFAGFLVGIGALHFVIPAQFEKIVPRWVPGRRRAVLWSGVAEIGAGALLAVPRTRKLGGWLATATIVAVYPANIQMTIDATRGGSRRDKIATWIRLPLQFPMIAKAYRYTR